MNIYELEANTDSVARLKNSAETPWLRSLRAQASPQRKESSDILKGGRVHELVEEVCLSWSLKRVSSR